MTTGLKTSELRIRMYRVGFGDCFLLSFPADAGHQHVLVDCGVHAQGDIHTMDRVIADIEKETDRSLAVVVATHAHRDHISGFAAGEASFRKFTIGQVWLPWTENKEDPLAAKLKKKHTALAGQLTQHFAAAGGSAETLAAVKNFAVNDEALRLLHTGFGVTNQVKFYEAGNAISKVEKIPGLSVKVLGPPRDDQFLSKMDPPKADRYLRVGAGGRAEPADAVAPFAESWQRGRHARALRGLCLSRKEEKQFRKMLLESSLDALAFALDSVLNNTSLVTLMAFRGRNLLFPGDAQYGNWKSWLEQEDADEILSGVDFYKVSHHGSFNATPKGAVEKMEKGHFAAMVSTQSKPWKSIPRMPLIKALEDRTNGNLVRSDSLAVPQAPQGPALSKLPKDFRQGALWFDYILSV